MRGIWIADIHVHPYRDCSKDGGQDRLKDGLSVVEQSLAEAERRKCLWMFGGDAKVHRLMWPQEALNGLLKLMDRYKDVPKVMLSGQHDGVGNENTGLRPFRDLATVYEEPVVVTFPSTWRIGPTEPVALWPWQPTWERMPSWLEEARCAKARAMFGHGYLATAMTGTRDIRLVKHTIPLNAIGLAGKGKVFRVAYMGDVHKQQAIHYGGAIVAHYSGSPYSLRWDELDPGKGCLYFDTETGHATQIPLRAPRHIILDVGEDRRKLDGIKPGMLTGHLVRVIATDWFTAPIQARFVKTHQPRWYQAIIQPVFAAREKDELLHAGMPKREVLERYIKMRPPAVGVDTGELLRAGLTILERTEQEQAGRLA